MGAWSKTIASDYDDGYYYVAGERSACYKDDPAVIIGGIWGDACNDGFRFTGIPIARGQRVTRARLRFRVNETSAPSSTVTIKMEKALNAQDLVTGDCNVANRALTTAYVSWTLPSVTVGQTIYTPDFSAVLQEVLEQPGFAYGNAVLVAILGMAGGSDYNYVKVVDYHNMPTYAATLEIEWVDKLGGGMM